MWYKKLKHATLEKYQNRNKEIAPLPTSPASKPEPTQHPLSEKTRVTIVKIVQSQERKKIGLNVPPKKYDLSSGVLVVSLSYCIWTRGLGEVGYVGAQRANPALRTEGSKIYFLKPKAKTKKEQIEAQQSTKTQSM